MTTTATTATPATRQMLAEARELFGADLIDRMVRRGDFVIVEENQGEHNGSSNSKN